MGIAIAEEVIAALHGEMVPNAVNLPTLQPTELKEMQGYLTLGEFPVAPTQFKLLRILKR